jgi:hypothetical protein
MGRLLHRRQRNWGARVSEYELDGLPVVFLENRRLRVGVLAGRGADVFEFLDKRSDVDLCWRSPRGLSNPARYVSTSPDPQSTFLDHYAGGWQEIFPNGGPAATSAEAHYGQHGEVCQLPWDYEVVEDTPQQVAVRFSVRGHKAPVLLERVLRLRQDDPVLEVSERLVNESPIELRAMWGQHIVLGTPYLAPGARIRLPDGVRGIPHPTAVSEHGRRVAPDGEFAWPLATGPTGGDVDLSVVPDAGAPSEMLYLTGFGDEGSYEVDGGGPTFRVTWDARVLPYLWLWQELGAGEGHPWYGRAYVMGLEPFSSHPTEGLPAAVENGTALRLGPHAERRLHWTAGLAGNHIPERTRSST